MSQKKKIAVAYLFAVPVTLAIVFYQRVTLTRVSGSTQEVRGAAELIQESDRVLALLKQAETSAQRYIASGGDSADVAAYRKSVSDLHEVLQQISEQTADEQALQASVKSLSDAVSKQVSVFNREISARGNRRAPSSHAAPLVSRDLEGDIIEAQAQINAVQARRLDHQRAASRTDLRRANLATTFGGGVVIWLVGVASFLLFHQEKTRVWAGVERRVHTKVLQALPMGVSVATDNGVILYSNPAEEALLGYRSGELLGNNATLLHDLEGPKGESTVQAILERLNVGLPWKGDLPLRRKDGTVQTIPGWVMNLEFPGKIYRVFVHSTG